MQEAPQTPRFTVQELQQYLQLTALFTGKKPTTLHVSPEAIDWYSEQVKQISKNFNIPTTKNYKKPEFMGVELVTQ